MREGVTNNDIKMVTQNHQAATNQSSCWCPNRNLSKEALQMMNHKSTNWLKCS